MWPELARSLGQLLWLVAPAVGAAVFHMLLVRGNGLAVLDAPLDGNRLWRGRPLLGRNKTWRGVIAMVGFSAGLAALQELLAGGWARHRDLSLIDAGSNPVGVASLQGAILGLGYVLGELPNSFLKRRFQIGPGERAQGWPGKTFFFVLDRSDSVVAALLLGWLAFGYPPKVVFLGIAVLPAVHLLVSGALYRTGIKHGF